MTGTAQSSPNTPWSFVIVALHVKFPLLLSQLNLVTFSRVPIAFPHTSFITLVTLHHSYFFTCLSLLPDYQFSVWEKGKHYRGYSDFEWF